MFVIIITWWLSTLLSLIGKKETWHARISTHLNHMQPHNKSNNKSASSNNPKTCNNYIKQKTPEKKKQKNFYFRILLIYSTAHALTSVCVYTRSRHNDRSTLVILIFISRSQNYLFIRLTLITFNRHLILSNVCCVYVFLFLLLLTLCFSLSLLRCNDFYACVSNAMITHF